MNTVKTVLAISAICLYLPVPANAQWMDVEPQRAQPVAQRQASFPQQRRQETLEQLRQMKLQRDTLGADQLMQGPGPFLSDQEPIRQEQAEPHNFQLPPGVRLPGMSAYQQTNEFTNPSAMDRSTAFFNGITPQQAAEAQYVPVDLSDHGALRSPEWAKQKVKIRQFTDVTEQHGNQDALGFF